MTFSRVVCLFEGTILAHDKKMNLAEQVEPIAQDAERIVGLHVDLLKSELRQASREITPALVGLGAGAGLALTAGILGSLALVHGLNRSTRLPLWGCFGLVGGLLGATGLGLMGSGARQLSRVSLVPYETIATLKEDVEWVKGKTK
jgi:hypothetical protein